MTNPVQIPRYSVQRDDDGSYLRLDQEGSLVGYRDHLADKEAALLQVRSLLEAKALGLKDEAEKLRVRNSMQSVDRAEAIEYCASELLSLAATLGNQGK